MNATNKQVRIKPGDSCATVDEVVALIGNRWPLLVIGTLRRNPTMRYNELERAVDGISQRMLTLTLKKLEENGLVTRTIYATVPPRVDYELSALGQTFAATARLLIEWTHTNRSAMIEARLAYASRKI